VDEFHRSGELHMCIAGIAILAGRRQSYNGPQALAAGINQMLPDLRDQSDFASHPGMDDLVNPGQIGAGQSRQPLDGAYTGWQRGGFPHIRVHSGLPPIFVTAF
jgi:hypothetical protein